MSNLKMVANFLRSEMSKSGTMDNYAEVISEYKNLVLLDEYHVHVLEGVKFINEHTEWNIGVNYFVTIYNQWRSEVEEMGDEDEDDEDYMDW